MHRLLPLAVATLGCAHSYTAISYDLTHRATGTVQTAVPRSGQHSGSVAIGFGQLRLGLLLVVLAARQGCEQISHLLIRKAPVPGFGLLRAAHQGHGVFDMDTPFTPSVINCR